MTGKIYNEWSKCAILIGTMKNYLIQWGSLCGVMLLAISGNARAATSEQIATTTSDTVTTMAADFEEISTPAVLADQPTIRVALGSVSSGARWRSSFFYTVMTGTTTLKDAIAPQALVELSYVKGLYKLTSGHIQITSPTPLRLVAQQPGSYFVVESMRRTIGGRKGNFNAYRGDFIRSYAPRSRK